jgi:hypothetical protein
MFSDQPVTPRRLEIVVDVVAEYGRSSVLRREQLLELLQPETLPNFNPNAESPRVASEQAVRAARDIGLIEEVEGGWRIVEVVTTRRGRDSRSLVLAAVDERVLNDTDVEPYFSLFYSYLLGLGAEADAHRDDQEWATAYNDVLHRGTLGNNPLNGTKVRGLWRWYPYAGLGWVDSGDVFQCEPYERVRRALPKVFGAERRLEADAFARALASTCPELDGGRLFQHANPESAADTRAFSLGLAQALIGLHEDKVIVLDCPRDSRGWDLSAGEPTDDGATLRSSRLDGVEWKPSSKRQRKTSTVA